MLSAQGRDADARRCASSIARRPCSTRGCAIAGAIFQQGAVALDQVSVTRRSASPRRRTERLQALTAGLSGALTSGDVAAIFIQAVIDSIGADAAALSVVDDDTGQMHAVAWRGIPDELIDERGVSLAGTAGARRRFAGDGLYYENIDELAADFPQSRSEPRRAACRRSRICRCGQPGRPSASRCSAGESVSLARDDRAFLEAIAGQCALALDRAQRYEAERDIAETLQRSVLPETIPSMEGVRVALSSRLVGGRRRRRLVRHADARRRQPRLRRR